MDWLIVYIVFALTTSICAWIFYYIPAVHEAKTKNIDNSFTRSPFISSVVYIVISTFIAPTIFIALFSQKQSKLFYNALREEILKQD
ncbi:hypothetical protein EB118_05640 [bacterium]|nr:hypothetical protein [bacterium]